MEETHGEARDRNWEGAQLQRLREHLETDRGQQDPTGEAQRDRLEQSSWLAPQRY